MIILEDLLIKILADRVGTIKERAKFARKINKIFINGLLSRKMTVKEFLKLDHGLMMARVELKKNTHDHVDIYKRFVLEAKKCNE